MSRDGALGGEPAAIRGLDNIALDLQPAGVGSRILAALVDYLLLTLIAVAVLLVAGISLAALEIPGGWIVALLLVAAFALNWGYFIVAEISGDGRSPGKRLARLRVVGRLGGTAPLRALVIRNLLRDVDLLVGAPLIFTDPLCRRLGDRLAGTLVVHEEPETSRLELGRIPPAWGAAEVAVIEALLARADELEPARAERLMRRALTLVERDAPELLDASEPAARTAERLRRALAVRRVQADHGAPPAAATATGSR